MCEEIHITTLAVKNIFNVSDTHNKILHLKGGSVKYPFKLMAGLALATGLGLALPAQRADAYPVDCAILLCLAGGWPASAECAHAKTVFIRRITPWPIEPPLQIWHCPMGVASHTQSPSSIIDSLRGLARGPQTGPSGAAVSRAAISGHRPPPPVMARFAETSAQTRSAMLHLARHVSTANGRADIDISGPDFDFLRSIKVWNVMTYSHRKEGREGECALRSNITLGTYGTQGEFRWRRISPAPVPGWVITRRSCEPSSYTRAVGVEWTDAQGLHGYELVRY